MLIDGKEVYLFNPWQIKRWTEEEIQVQVSRLIDKFDPHGDTMYQMALNIEVMANIRYLFGEMIARLTKEQGMMKIDCDNKENKAITVQRRKWVKENPGEKAPAMSFFEAEASELVRNDRDRLQEVNGDLTRFKEASENYESIMNAIKKKMEAVKFEEFNQ